MEKPTPLSAPSERGLQQALAAYLVGLAHGGLVAARFRETQRTHRPVSIGDLVAFASRAGRQWELVTIGELIAAAKHYAYLLTERESK